MGQLLIATLLGAVLAADARAQGARGSRGAPPPSGRALDRLSRMPPKDRRRVLERLPPERRQQLEERLERYNALPPDERQRLQDQLERFRTLPPERQEAARNLFRRFLSLPEDRRKLLREEFQHLRTLSPAGRQERLDSEEIRKRFSRAERDILEDYVKLLPPPDGNPDDSDSGAILRDLGLW